MSSELIGITGSAAVSAMGAGVQTAADRLLRGESGISRGHRFAHDEQDAVAAAAIPEDVLRRIADAGSSAEPSLPAALSIDVARTALAQADESDPHRPTGSCGLVIATTKSAIDQMTDLILGQRVAKVEHVRPPSLLRDVADALGIHGPRVVVSNACASGLAAMIQAARWLRRGVCDRVLVIGVDVLGRFAIRGFSCLGAMSRAGCRPFDATRDGMTLGEAAAALVLRRVDHNQTALGRMAGWGASSDAFHLTAPHPRAEGLIHALRDALRTSGLSPTQIRYINAHGTGTVHNDEMESVAYQEVFGDGVPVTSMKPCFGHTLGAAGVLEAAVCLELMRRGVVPANAGLAEPGVRGRILLPTHCQEGQALRYTATVKTGFGGLNAVVILEAGGDT